MEKLFLWNSLILGGMRSIFSISIIHNVKQLIPKHLDLAITNYLEVHFIISLLIIVGYAFSVYIFLAKDYDCMGYVYSTNIISSILYLIFIGGFIEALKLYQSNLYDKDTQQYIDDYFNAICFNLLTSIAILLTFLTAIIYYLTCRNSRASSNASGAV